MIKTSVYSLLVVDLEIIRADRLPPPAAAREVDLVQTRDGLVLVLLVLVLMVHGRLRPVERALVEPQVTVAAAAAAGGAEAALGAQPGGVDGRDGGGGGRGRGPGGAGAGRAVVVGGLLEVADGAEALVQELVAPGK